MSVSPRRLAREALTSEWQEEQQIAAYVRQWARIPVQPAEVVAALAVLEQDGLAESLEQPGYRGALWRRASGRAA